jgi:hypothetical protein
VSPPFTPGPWEAWPTPDGSVAVRKQYRDEQGRRVTTWPAVCGCNTLPNEANAALIAAAPDLYATLCALVIAVNSDGPFPFEAVDRATAALRKARGES